MLYVDPKYSAALKSEEVREPAKQFPRPALEILEHLVEARNDLQRHGLLAEFYESVRGLSRNLDGIPNSQPAREKFLEAAIGAVEHIPAEAEVFVREALREAMALIGPFRGQYAVDFKATLPGHKRIYNALATAGI